MASDDYQEQSRQPDEGVRVSAELAALTARVESLERQLAELQEPASVRMQESAPPPPRPTSVLNAEITPLPNIAKRFSKPNESLENRIVSQLFSRIGIVALLAAATLFFNWAID